MTKDDALHLIAAYGADAARWPAEARAAVQGWAMRDAEVAAALADAQAMDSLLDRWASDVPPRQFDVAALIPAPVALPGKRPESRPLRTLLRTSLPWAGGGAVAAALALAMVGTNFGAQAPTAAPSRNIALESDSAPAASPESSEEMFALIFTPTADEEDLI